MNRVLDNLKLVKYIAHRYALRNYIPFDDCYQEGCIGLMRADREYVEGDVPFSAFAAKHIKWAISNFIKSNGRIYAPSHIKDTANMIKSRKLEDVPDEILVKQLNKTESTVANAKLLIKTEIKSLDMRMNAGVHDEDDYSLVKAIHLEVDFDTALFFEQALAKISEQYREPLKLYVQGFTNKDIAGKLGITEMMAKGRIMTGKARIRAKKGELLDEIYSV